MTIELPNGTVIGGKWWGKKSVKPFICLHGWQDNAGTFDRLIPLLPQQFSYLSLDFPGHGKSSWQPHGVSYQVNSFLFVLYDIIKKLNYEKVGLIAHSMGGWTAFIFASMFPKMIDMLVTVDIWKLLDRTIDEQISDLSLSIKNFESADKRVREGIKPPTYEVEEMITKIHEGSMGNVSLESAAHLLKRNIAKSENGKFYFTRDNRLRQMFLLSFPRPLIIHMAKQIEFPFLFLAAVEDTPLYRKVDFYNEFIEIIMKKREVELVKIHSDNHYFHINEPEKIAKVVSEFIMRHGKVHRL